MRSRLWRIPAIAVYFYIATVLVEYGYAVYFNIPPNFLDSSLSDNIIFFFQLVTLSQYAAGQLGLLAWIVVIVVFGGVWFIYHSNKFWRFIIGSVGTVLFFLILLGSYSFGKLIASTSTSFWIPSSDCQSIGKDNKYIVPQFFQSQAIFIPIDQNNKMVGGFIVKTLADLNCKLEFKNIGRVVN